LPIFTERQPIVVSCRGSLINIAPYTPGREGLAEGLRATFERSACVHCVSDDIVSQAERYGLHRRKVKVIRPAVDPAIYSVRTPPRRDDDVLRLITVGSLIWKKGLEYMLQSLALLKGWGVRAMLDIVGEGIDRQRVVYTISDLNLNDTVTLHGRMTPTNVARMLAASDVFLLASLSEGISNAVIEAMASGLPVVTTDCGGMREAVTDGVEGFLVPPRDPTAMARAIEALSADRDLRAQMGRSGRERVIRDFTLDAQIAEWIELFESVAT
jgi:colanic acid/amylovoran biosynthesis glycosyltransferase